MTALSMPMPFDPVAEVRAILASIDTMLGGVVAPAAEAKPRVAKARKSETRMLGDFCKVSWRKTSGGLFREPAFTNPHACDAYSTKIDSLATYIAKLASIGCVAVGTDEATGATIYRTPEGTTLKVRAEFGGPNSLQRTAIENQVRQEQNRLYPDHEGIADLGVVLDIGKPAIEVKP